MLELGKIDTWEPPELSRDEIDRYKEICKEICLDREFPGQDFFIIFKTQPYIDALYFRFTEKDLDEPDMTIRYPFHEGYFWSPEETRIFIDRCLHNPRCRYSHPEMGEIFEYYSEKHPDWHLKPYYTEHMKLLDHIYNCMQSGTIKEILYKAELDHLAARSDKLDEVNLLSTRPSDIYPGLSMRTLRALNCGYGSELVNTEEYREFIRKLQQSHPDIFKDRLNDAQCRYILDLIEHRLTPNEVGRLYAAAKERLSNMWCSLQYDLFMSTDKTRWKRMETIARINAIDPLYKAHYPQDPDELANSEYNYRYLEKYLLGDREGYDKAIRRANRKRPQDRQERTDLYIMRYPQTINDFCREAVYMKNCLSGYIQAVLNNETDILFMRRADDVNKPFITLEVHHNVLREAYHRFNEDCTPEEADWIRAYCERHGIDASSYHFDRTIDI
ncbi:MAG: PcfJ domain-containing protein [Lachnospiraceae bacterium]|nr:PcfJ domain-containing protein [Lachnospiraceae bacterium]